MCDEGAGVPYNSSRAERLKKLCSQLSLDAIILITGFDGCYNLESKGIVEWLCDGAASAADFTTAAVEEGLFCSMPAELAWHVDMDIDDMAEDAVSALDRLLANPGPAAAAGLDGGCIDVDMADGVPAAAAAAGCPVDVAASPEVQQQADVQHVVQPDGKLSLLLQLHPQLRRVGIALGVEVRGGVQQQVPVEAVYRWPLLMALAEQLQLPMEQLFQEVVDITPCLRPLLGYVDGTHLSNTLRQRRPLLTRAWLETLGVCGRRSNTPKLDLTEATIAAPVTDFVSGCGCRLKPGQYQPLALPPRVLFGTRTSQQEALSCPNITLRSQAAKQGCAVLHATVEAADACSPLRVARTIFFSQGAAAADTPLQLRLQVLQQQQQQQQPSPQGRQGVGGSPAPPPANAVPAAAAAAASAGTSGSKADAMCRCNSAAVNNEAGACAAGQQPAGQQQEQQLLQQEQQLLQQQLPLGKAMSGGDYDVDHTDLFDLMCWYWAVVDAAWQCMEFYSTQSGATWTSAQAFATQVFWSSAAAAQLACLQPSGCCATPQQQQQPNSQQPLQQQAPQWPEKPQLQLQLFSWDGGPRPMPSWDGADLQPHNHRFKTLRLTVSNIRSRSPAHPGKELGSVLYMDTFVDAPAVGNCPTQLINLTLTHCPTYTFDLWGTEAALNTQRVATFRRHLQQQLQSQLQAESQAQAAAIRRSADDSVVLRMQLQQGLKAGTGKAGTQRRASFGQQQQLLLLQQLAAAGNGRGNSTQQQQQRQQFLMQLQQQQKARSAAGSSSIMGGRPEHASGSKHALATSCCGEAGRCDSSSVKRSCCEPAQNCNASAAPSEAAADGWQAVLTAGDGAAAGDGVAVVPSPPAASAGGAVVGAGGSDGGCGTSREAPATAQCWRQLGKLLVAPGEMPGEVALVLTGAMKLAVMDGPLYAHSNGLVFVSRPTKVHVLLLDQMEAVWLQDFAGQIAGYPDLGPCIVIRGTQPCCGLLPAMHMTDNNHLAIPLRAMSKACSQHWVTAVLPAWQAAASVVKSSKGASAPWPLPAHFQPFYSYWLQGPRKRFMVPQPDDSINQLVHLLDRPQQQQRQQQ